MENGQSGLLHAKKGQDSKGQITSRSHHDDETWQDRRQGRDT